ncbi:MAG: sugar phosphate isomerase/epimerase [Planctomycetales bacterium]|nr:sugar phosphate isomerase/epimerase [Planctomycetales bacterium]
MTSTNAHLNTGDTRMADFIYCLNTATIRPASLMDKITITAETGYDAIELWVNDVEDYVEAGGSVGDVAKALDDTGLQRPSMISLREWCTEDDKQFAEALDAARRRLEIARALSVAHIVAGPPGGVIPLNIATERYEKLLEVSLEYGVPASVEFLGFVKGINTLEDAWAICGGTGMSEATITPDAWHMFRGGSNFKLLEEIPGDHISCFHWNDAVTTPPREEQNDSHRVFPTDGIMDLKALADVMRRKDWHGALSLELFNPEYWKRDPREVAREGLEKMKLSIA